MNNVTRILIVEDLIPDYELAQREIRRAVKQCEFERVETQQDFLRALQEFQPDLVLSDYKLPGFDGAKVLKLAQNYLPSVPVIIWTGVMGESIAVECLKKGASDYLLKDEIKRLGPAILRALEERNLLLENKRAEERYQTIFENALEGIFQSTPGGRYLSVNPAMAHIYGYASPAEMIDTVTNIGTQIYAEPHSRDRFIALLMKNDRVKNFEMKNIRKDGSIIWTSTSARVVRDENGTVVYYEGFLQDITERRQIENAEREQRMLTEALRHTAEALSSTLDYREVLDQILTAVGSLVPSDAATIMLIEDGKARVVRSRGYLERGLKSEVMELELALPDTANLREMVKTTKPVIVSNTDAFPDWKTSPANEWIRSNVGVPISLRGEVIGFILLDSETPGFFKPVHAERLEAFANQAAIAIHNSRLLHQAQEEIKARKRTEQALRESEERFRLIAQNADDWIWTMDVNFQITYVSPSVERTLGYSIKEILATSPEQLLTPESYELGLKAFKEEVENIRFEPDPNYNWILELEYLRKDGSRLWIETKFSFFRDPSGYPTAVLGVGRDITERKQVEAHVKDLLEFNEKIITHSPLGILIYKLTGECIFANENAGVILGARGKELASQNFHTIPSWKPSGLYDLANRAISTNSVSTADIHILSTFGKDLWLRSYFVPFSSRGEDHLLLAIGDITDHKLAEEKLRESENRLILALSAAQMSVWDWNLKTNTVMWSPELCEITGISETAFDGTFDGYTDLIHPQDAAHVREAAARAVASDTMFAEEFRIVRPDGEVRWLSNLGHAEYNGSGTSVRMMGTVQDITRRKHAEEEISRRAKETSALLETSLALTNLDLKAILRDIGNSAKNLFSADGCRIFLMQPDGETLRCVLALQESPSAFLSLVIKLGEGVTGSVAASGRAEIVNEMRNDPRAVHVPGTLEEEDEALMFAPLKERDRTIGVLSIRRIGTDRPFGHSDLEFLEAYASMAASAVSNARLFEETQRILSELEALYENGLAVSQLLEPRQIGDRIIETFSRHLSWHHVAIRLLNANTEELALIAFNQPGLKYEERKKTEHRLNSLINRVGQGLSGWAVEIGQPVRTGNVWEYPQYVGTYPGIKSGMYMPLRVGEQVIGIISVESEEPDFFTAQDERLLATLANQAAIALENARLYQAAQQEITERKLAEEELRESQERYRLLIETSPDGIIMMNMDGIIRFSNLQMAGLFNFETPGALLGIDFISLFSVEERAFLEQHGPRYILEDQAQEGHWFIRKDGSSFFGELHSSALCNEKGEQYAFIAQLRDVTERTHSQDALREERQRFLDLFENSPIPTWLEDFSSVAAWMDELRAKGVINLKKFLEENPDEYRVGVRLIRVLDVNHAAVIMNGAQNRQELLHILQDLILDKTPSSIMIHEFDMIWQGNTSFGFEMSSSKLVGSPVAGILHIYIPANNGQPDYTRVIVTSTDITERVEIERRLRASELHYRELADSITDVLFELDHNLRYTHWNKASEMLMGIPASQAIGNSMFEILGESEEQARIGRIYKSVLEDARAKTFETEITLRGQKLVFEINANPSTHGVSVVARNITERKLSETLMQKRFELVEYSAHHSFEEVLQKTINDASELTGSHIGFLHFVDEDETKIRLQAWSTETLQNFCRADDQGMHYPVNEAGVWADAVRYRHSIIHNDYEALPGRKGIPQGHTRLIREMVIPIMRNERIVAVIGVGNKELEYTRQDIEIAERFADYAWDITERKQMESTLAEERNQLAKRVEERTADLSRANSNLARALRVKDEFLANVSHELRTPLNAILGLSESLGEQVAGPLNEKQQKYLSTINESGHHLLALINDILDLAKIEAGQITLDINKVDVNSVCQASLRMIKQLAQKKNQEVVFEIDSDLGLMWADERRLKQMIVNLLSNAVKFTPEYSRIGLIVHGDRAANKVVITVWDTGIGIKEDDLERLFKPFVQLDSGLAREATGTGLGLALVAQMARLHGGSVHALSKPGEGSRFIIQLPWEPAMATDMAAHLRNTGKFRAIDPNAQRPTILLIEDTREVVMMLADYLEMAGYNLVTAQDGVDGLEQAKLTYPDLILMDIQMPRMDGFETTQKIRSDPAFRNIPIIALTALAMPNDRQRCLDAGMDEYISKPVNLKALTKTIQKFLSSEAGGS